MTRDFAADLSQDVIYVSILLWLLWFLSTHDMGVVRRPNGQVFPTLLTDDVRIFDQI